MTNYKTGRVVATSIIGLGWIVTTVSTFLSVIRLVRTDPALWATAFPLVIYIAFGLLLVLAGFIARAVFDMADRAANGAA